MDPRRVGRLNPWTVALSVAFLAAAAAAVLARGGTWLDEGAPTLTPADLVVLATALVAGAAFGGLALGLERQRLPEAIGAPGLLLVAASVALGLVAAVLLVVAPQSLTALLVEDGLAENASAAMLLAGAAALLVAAIRHRRDLPQLAACVLGALLLAVIGFEEVSWFQRITQTPTPEWLAEINQQGELSFHNVNTVASENLYYAGAFALCILSRYLPGRLALPFPPALAVTLSAAVACAMSYDMWGIAHMQIMFYMALSVLLAIAAAGWTTDRRMALLAIVVAGAMAAMQGTYLAFGGNFGRLWDITELRETVIALSLFGFAVQILATPVRHQPLSLRPAGA